MRFVAGGVRLKPYPGHREPFPTLSAQDSSLSPEKQTHGNRLETQVLVSFLSVVSTVQTPVSVPQA